MGQFGFGNVGDEGILQAIMDSLGLEHEYTVATSLPFTMTQIYSGRIPNATEVRTLDDTRVDYDACIYGGGKIDWGFGWGFFLRAFTVKIPTMAYGISLRLDEEVPRKLWLLYSEYFKQFNAVAVRDTASQVMLAGLSVSSQVTTCPASALKEEKTTCPENAIAVCPRFGDYNNNGEVDNSAQVDWFVNRLGSEDKDKINLIPFFPTDLEGHLRDFELCKQINTRLGGGCNIFPCNGYNARKVKYAISRSKLVISGGRYHAIVWAMAHGIPYEIAPTVQGIAFSKIKALIDTQKLGLESDNKILFEGLF